MINGRPSKRPPVILPITLMRNWPRNFKNLNKMLLDKNQLQFQMKSLPDNYKLKKTVPKSPKDLVELLPHPQQQQLQLFHPHQDLKVVQEALKPKVHHKPVITVKSAL